jgi:HSP20 family protein
VLPLPSDAVIPIGEQGSAGTSRAKEETMLSRWNPFHELWNYDETWQGARFQPAVDVYEEENAIVLRAEIPGLTPEDIKLDVHGNTLTLSGERKFEKRTEERGVHRVESAYGSFRRSFTLPDTVETDDIDAELRDGILSVRLPKSARARARSIAVRGAGEAQSLPTEQQKRNEDPRAGNPAGQSAATHS